VAKRQTKVRGTLK